MHLLLVLVGGLQIVYRIRLQEYGQEVAWQTLSEVSAIINSHSTFNRKLNVENFHLVHS